MGGSSSSEALALVAGPVAAEHDVVPGPGNDLDDAMTDDAGIPHCIAHTPVGPMCEACIMANWRNARQKLGRMSTTASQYADIGAMGHRRATLDNVYMKFQRGGVLAARGQEA